jgi:hypothetical protein
MSEARVSEHNRGLNLDGLVVRPLESCTLHDSARFYPKLFLVHGVQANCHYLITVPATICLKLKMSLYLIPIDD